MFCPHCGAKSPHGLKYCKRCGGNLAESGEPVSRSSNGPVWATALASIMITLVGLGIVMSHAFDLARPLYPGEVRMGDGTMVAAMMIVFGTLTILFIVGLLIRFASRLTTGQTAETPRFGKQATNAPPAAQIPAPPQAVGSVVEHTTRNFDIDEDAVHMREPGGRMTR